MGRQREMPLRKGNWGERGGGKVAALSWYVKRKDQLNYVRSRTKSSPVQRLRILRPLCKQRSDPLCFKCYLTVQILTLSCFIVLSDFFIHHNYKRWKYLSKKWVITNYNPVCILYLRPVWPIIRNIFLYVWKVLVHLI